MPWWLWILLIFGWVLYAVAVHRRNRRVQVVISISQHGSTTIQIHPPSADPQDLALTALCYGALIHWSLANEFSAIQSIYKELCAEMVDFWNESGVDLVDRCPSASALRASPESVHAVEGGESYQITLYRTGHVNLRNTAWVGYRPPRPGLLANVPWSVVLLFNAVWAVLDDDDRRRFGLAVANWYVVTVGANESFTGRHGLKALWAHSFDAARQAFVEHHEGAAA